MTKYYAGIGARSTPKKIQAIMTLLASRLEQEGWILRSGGADGADSAFERGIRNPQANAQIYLPDNYFKRRTAGQQPQFLNYQSLPGAQQAMATVQQYHPAPHRLSDYARHLMARNAMQLLGPDMRTPSKLIVAYTEDGKTIGGTGQALRMGNTYQIPIRNLGDEQTLSSVQRYLGLI